MITMKVVTLWRKEGLSTQELLFVKECIICFMHFSKIYIFHNCKERFDKTLNQKRIDMKQKVLFPLLYLNYRSINPKG